jgi:hypothetical protein
MRALRFWDIRSRLSITTDRIPALHRLPRHLLLPADSLQIPYPPHHHLTRRALPRPRPIRHLTLQELDNGINF